MEHSKSYTKKEIHWNRGLYQDKAKAQINEKIHNLRNWESNSNSIQSKKEGNRKSVKITDTEKKFNTKDQ